MAKMDDIERLMALTAQLRRSVIAKGKLIASLSEEARMAKPRDWEMMLKTNEKVRRLIASAYSHTNASLDSDVLIDSDTNLEELYDKLWLLKNELEEYIRIADRLVAA